MSSVKERALGDATRQEPKILKSSIKYSSSKTLELNYFPNVFQKFPRPFKSTWPSLRLELINRTFKPNNPIDKLTGPCISAAKFQKGHSRGVKHVLSISMLVLDMDNKGPVIKNLHAVKPCFEQFSSVVYTTWSHKPKAPRFRLIFPLTRDVYPGEWERFVLGFLQKQGLDRPGLVDIPAALDLARLNLLPLERNGVKPQSWMFDGEWVNPDMFILPPKPIRKPKPKCRAQWASKTRADLRTLRLADLLADSGLITKETSPYQGARRWRTSCPWHLEHSDQRDTLDAVILHDEGIHWPSWSCSHAHCQGRGLKDILSWCGVAL